MSRHDLYRRRPTGGFTLVEILFVVLVIMILMALLLTAVQAALRASRRASCQKNQAEIGRSIRYFINQFDGRTAGTIPDSGANTGGFWTVNSGSLRLPSTPANNSGNVGMQGWDGYMAYSLQQYEEEARRMWTCTETFAPYIGNVFALGRQVNVPKFRQVNYQAGNPGLPLGTEIITQIQNQDKCILVYDAGIGLVGEGGVVPGITDNNTDFDDGGGSGLVPSADNTGFMWYSGPGVNGPFIEGPHQKVHMLLRADGSVDSIGEPGIDPGTLRPDPLTSGELVTNPNDPSQANRRFTRFPKSNLSGF